MRPLPDFPVIVPDWAPAPQVRAWVTCRTGGRSAGPYGGEGGAANGLNLAEHVADDPGAVRANRQRLQAALPGPVRWLQQVHGSVVHDADAAWSAADAAPCADAAITTRPHQVLAVLTADCLPIFLADDSGGGVGLAHAGWRGLLAGVAEATVQALRARLRGGARLHAWLGPAIGPTAFEVGPEVRQAFCADDPSAASAFVAAARPGHWRADLYALARQRLLACGVATVAGGTHCTVTESGTFYSYRRDACTGRMASLIWLSKPPGL